MKTILFTLCVVSAALLLAGCSSSGGGAPYTPRDRTAPTVTDFTAAPADGAWRGGPCRVTVAATDNVAVTAVIARISGPGATADAVPVPPAGAGQYQGDVPVPPNTNSNGAANTYFITVWAHDAEGNTGASAQSIQVMVPAPEGPLPPPAW
jgi:hypothetical protein